MKNIISLCATVALMCLLCASCTTRCASMTEYVHDTLVAYSLVHDTCFRQTVRHDTLFITRTIKTETTITQDTAGTIINRERNTIRDSDTYRASVITEKDYQARLLHDSLASSKLMVTQAVTEKAESDNWFTRLWHIILQIICAVIVLLIGYVIGIYRE